jgi:glucokinase
MLNNLDATIGIDLGGSKCAGVLLDAQGEVIASSHAATPYGSDAVIAVIVEAYRELASRADEAGATVVGVGVGVPGLVTKTGMMRYAPHLFGVLEVPLRDLLAEKFRANPPKNTPREQMAVIVENDNTAAAWAEHVCGAGQGRDEMVYVGFGTGIGGAAVVGGRLLRGKHGFAGELGHFTIDRNGPKCVCGRSGCWEMFASGNGLGRLAGRPGVEVTDGAARGDEASLAMLKKFSVYMADGLADLVAIFDPEMIVLGGGVLSRSEPLLSMVREALPVALGDAGDHRAMPTVLAARLGPRAGAIGAALLARP